MGSQPKEETLDPEDWDEMTALGHRMLDDIMKYLETIRKLTISVFSGDGCVCVGRGCCVFVLNVVLFWL
jgi:hypothetical protein